MIRDGTIKVHICSTSFNGQGQTMQFKTINPWHPDDALYSGWFTVPTNNYVTVSKRPQRYSYKLCATFGGGIPGVMYWWRGFLEVE